uniref:Uncharacterized protein n=1 Tax=Tetradesmus obliquus TaxID=3088 RepID=A0A383VHP6_TETOB
MSASAVAAVAAPAAPAVVAAALMSSRSTTTSSSSSSSSSSGSNSQSSRSSNIDHQTCTAQPLCSAAEDSISVAENIVSGSAAVIQVMSGAAPVTVKDQAGSTTSCITTNTPCPGAAPVTVKDQAGSTTSCITTNTPCPGAAPVTVKDQAGSTASCITTNTPCPGAAPVTVKDQAGSTTSCITTNTPCPGAAPVTVKDQAGSTTSCITTNTPCPGAAPVTVKDQAGSTTSCITTNTPCPGCNVPDFLIMVQNSAGGLIGCTNTASHDGPLVGFRGTAPAYPIAYYRDVTSCPVYSTTPGSANTEYTVPLLPANVLISAVPKACLTVPATAIQACPGSATLSQLNYPVEVMLADPSGCGGDSGACTTSRVIACYVPGT